MSREETITVTEPQRAFHQMTCKYPLFVGGFGSGKSETMLNQAIMDATISDEALIALYAPTYQLVRLIIAERLCTKLEQLGIKYKYNKTENRIYTFAPGFGNFIMMSLDKPSKLVGYESYSAHVDELDTLPEDQAAAAWKAVIARNRQDPNKEGDACFNRAYAYSTPEGFRFCYKRWVEGASSEYQLTRAPTYSNPKIPKDYVQTLRDSYPSNVIDAYIEGMFTNFASGTVYNAYDKIKCSSSQTIQPNEDLHIGVDFNVKKQAATIYVLRQDGKEWHAVDELIDMYDTPAMIEIMLERYKRHKIYIYPDASGNNSKSVGASQSDLSLLEQAGFVIRAKRSKTIREDGRPSYVNPAIKDRVMSVNGALDNGRMFVNIEKCPTVSKCLEQQGYDKNGEPDKKSGTDHSNDATGYPIVYSMPIRKPVAIIDVNYSI